MEVYLQTPTHAAGRNRGQQTTEYNRLIAHHHHPPLPPSLFGINFYDFLRFSLSLWVLGDNTAYRSSHKKRMSYRNRPHIPPISKRGGGEWDWLLRPNIYFHYRFRPHHRRPTTKGRVWRVGRSVLRESPAHLPLTLLVCKDNEVVAPSERGLEWWCGDNSKDRKQNECELDCVWEMKLQTRRVNKKPNRRHLFLFGWCTATTTTTDGQEKTGKEQRVSVVLSSSWGA